MKYETINRGQNRGISSCSSKTNNIVNNQEVLTIRYQKIPLKKNSKDYLRE